MLNNERTEQDFITDTDRGDTADLSHYDTSIANEEHAPRVTTPAFEGEDPLSEVTSIELNVSSGEEEGLVEDADVDSETTPAAVADGIDLPQEIFGHLKGMWAWGKTVPFVDSLLSITEDVATKMSDTKPKEEPYFLLTDITPETDLENPPAKPNSIEEAFSFETCASTDSENSGTPARRVSVQFQIDDTPKRSSQQDTKRPSLLSNAKRSSSRTLTNDQVTSTRNVLKAVDQSGDEELDPYELQSLFASQGILVPLDVVITVFNEIDEDRNGLLTVEEFAAFLHKSKFHQRVDFCKRMWFHIDWWCIMLWLVGGFLFLIGCFYVECESTSVFLYDKEKRVCSN